MSEPFCGKNCLTCGINGNVEKQSKRQTMCSNPLQLKPHLELKVERRHDPRTRQGGNPPYAISKTQLKCQHQVEALVTLADRLAQLETALEAICDAGMAA